MLGVANNFKYSQILNLSKNLCKDWQQLVIKL